MHGVENPQSTCYISQGENEGEGGGDDEDDNDGFFVPHGYLSDDEGVDEEMEEESELNTGVADEVLLFPASCSRFTSTYSGFPRSLKILDSP